MLLNAKTLYILKNAAFLNAYVSCRAKSVYHQRTVSYLKVSKTAQLLFISLFYCAFVTKQCRAFLTLNNCGIIYIRVVNFGKKVVCGTASKKI